MSTLRIELFVSFRSERKFFNNPSLGPSKQCGACRSKESLGWQRRAVDFVVAD
jgi:hypothetical protein